MATHINSVAEVENWEIEDGLVTITPTSGSNRFLLNAAGAISQIGVPTISTFKYGGSGGTTMTALGAQVALHANTGAIRGAYATAGPTSSSDLYVDNASTPTAPQRVGIGGMAYEGVDQTTPYSDYTTTAPTTTESVTTLLCSITVPNLTAGQTAIACVVVYFGGLDSTAFTAQSGTTLRASAIGTDAEPKSCGIAFLEKVASGAGSVTLEVNANQTTSDSIGFAAIGMRLNDAATGYTITAGQGSYSLTGQTVNPLFSAIVTAGQGSYSLTGQATTLTYTPLVNRTITAEQGSYTLTGQAQSLSFGRALQALVGTYSLNGITTGLIWSGAIPSTGYLTQRMTFSRLKIGL